MLTTHENELQLIEDNNPLSMFMYGLKAKETKRQYPNRLKVFMDYRGLEGSIEKQANHNLVLLQYSAFKKCKQIWCFFFFVKCPRTGKAYTLQYFQSRVIYEFSPPPLRFIS